MHRKSLTLLVAIFIFSISYAAHALEVVPIGQTIKPEAAPESDGGGSSRRTKRRPAASAIASGKSINLESAQILSSAMNREGETVYFRAAENVGPSSRPVIRKGAIARGTLVSVDSNKKNGKLVVQLSSIEAADGDNIKIKGEARIEEQGSPAVLTVGKNFTATLEEKATVQGRHKKEAFPSFDKSISADIRAEKLKANLSKGSIKGNVELVLDPGTSFKAADINPDSVVIYRVNNEWLPEEVIAIGGKFKVGDRNKDGNDDLSLQFDPLSFIKYQPTGNNTVYIKAKLANGSEVGASGSVNIDY